MNTQEFQLVVAYVNEIIGLSKKGMELDGETRRLLIEADPKLFVELRKIELETGAKVFDRLADSIDNLVNVGIPLAANAQKELAQARVIESNNNLTSAKIQADVELKETQRKIDNDRRQQRSSYTNGAHR